VKGEVSRQLKTSFSPSELMFFVVIYSRSLTMSIAVLSGIAVKLISIFYIFPTLMNVP